jgi:hypothetical protein
MFSEKPGDGKASSSRLFNGTGSLFPYRAQGSGLANQNTLSKTSFAWNNGWCKMYE